MFKFLSILACCIVICHGQTKIIGGDQVLDFEPYKYIATLKMQSEDKTVAYLCGGAVINSKHVVTAGHCVYGMFKMVVRVGSLKRTSGGQTYVADSFKPHPNYNPTTNDYDVGIVKTLCCMSATLFTPIAFPTGDEILDKVRVSGFGLLSEDATTIPDDLYTVVLSTIPNDQCIQQYAPYTEFTVTDRSFCAGVPGGGKDSCQGDSGSVLVIDNTKIGVGIVSSGLGCARDGLYGINIDLRNSEIGPWVQSETDITYFCVPCLVEELLDILENVTNLIGL